ncbi:putative tRNA 2'-phosphotransferase 1 [Stipitochalara longipes BDJ]|nr:putative tRNA 2'-phosphotransferase 1 [Stipitochalara longipes BDJ]
MAAAVLQPLQSLSLNHEIMAPSPISPNAVRHGRGRHGGSVAKGNKARGRGYSIVDERDTMVSKALTWVLKRTIEEGDEQDEGEEKLVADSEGFVDCEDLLAQPHLSALQVTFPELQSLIASPTSKARFSLKLKSSSAKEEDLDASDYLIRLAPSAAPASPTSASAPKLTPLSLTTEDLPDLIVYETSYPNYPLILASGSIKRAGGQAMLSFAPISISDDGSEIKASSDADVSIYIPLRSLMEANPKVLWQRTESGSIVTEGDAKGEVSKKYWKKVVARRADIGVLYEDGEVRKEVPVGLRGKGVKAKKGGKGKGKGGLKEMKARSEDEGTASD